MKTLLFKTTLLAIIIASFAACKKEVYPEELQFLVIDSITQKPIANATIQLIKVWRHPVKIGDNSKEGDWLPEYGRKQTTEIQKGTTDKYGKVTFTQEHKKYLYIIPGAMADGYQMSKIDTLSKFKKDKLDGITYKIVMRPLIKTTFIFKSNMLGNETDSVVFSSCDQVKVMHGAQIDDKMIVYTSNYLEPYSKVWYGGTVYRRGKKVSICHYVISYPQDSNEFIINIDM